MKQESLLFGEELRRRRLTAGLTLTQLAQLVHYSKSQISKVERGIKPPSRDLARLCDSALRANGALASLVRERPDGTRVPGVESGDGEVWLMQLSAGGQSWVQQVSRRQMLTAGALAIPGIYIGKPGVLVSANGGDAETADIFRSLFDQYRQLGQVAAPGLLVPTLVAQTHALQELAKAASPRATKELLILASRFAEYVGWLVQETGNDLAALWWTRRAVDLAAAGGDSGFATYGLVRHALVTLYRDDAAQTVQLARHAQTVSVSPRIRGLAALREAQGHALAGDSSACMVALECANTLLNHAAAETAQPVIGARNLAEPAEMIKGWCLYDLGRPLAAAEVLDQQLVTIPTTATRTRIRYSARRALAYATAGEVEHACHLATELLDNAIRIESATIAKDLRTLSRTLGRHQKDPWVRELIPRLSIALRSAGSQRKEPSWPRYSSTTEPETATKRQN